jgi:periplasmic protein CpxP/Spy
MKRLNSMKKIAIALLMAFAVAVPVVVAQSTDTEQGKVGRRGGQGRQWVRRDGDRFSGRMFGDLDLTDAQKAQMKQIRESHQPSLRSLHAAVRTKRQELRQAGEGSTFNEALVSQKLAEIAPLEAKVMGEEFRIRQEMLAVLTPEQKTKMEQSREQFKMKSGERRARKQQKTQ